jgi:hypothetical protein
MSSQQKGMVPNVQLSSNCELGCFITLEMFSSMVFIANSKTAVDFHVLRLVSSQTNKVLLVNQRNLRVPELLLPSGSH